MKYLKIGKSLAAASFFIFSMGYMSCNSTKSLAKSTTSNGQHAEAIISGTYADTTVDGKATFDEVGSAFTRAWRMWGYGKASSRTLEPY